MKKQFLLAAILSVLFVGALHFSSLGGHVYAQGIAGDSLCGSSSTTQCTPKDLEVLTNKVFLLFASVGTAILFLFIIGRIIYSAYLYMFKDAGEAELARARTQSFNMLIGYGIIIAVFGGLYMMGLQMFGVNEKYLKLLQFFSFDGFIEHAYAQEGLTNTLSSDNAYDIIISGISLAMRFFVYPSLVVLWVASGFKLVYSQGNPEGLKTARKWFLVSFVVTVIAFTLQGFIISFRETALKVFGSPSVQNGAPSPSSPGSSASSCAGKAPNTACTVSGRQGVCGYSDGTEGSVYGCYVVPGNGTAPYSVQRVTDCTGKPKNTVCTVGGRNGLCDVSDGTEGSVYGCYVGECTGHIGLDGICYTAGRR